MIVSDVKTRVSRIIGDDDLLFVTAADLLRWINDAQTDIVRKTECLQAISTIATSVGVSSYTIPSDVMYLKRVALKDKVLTILSSEQIDSFTGSINQSGFNYSFMSGCYYVWSDKIYVNPNDCGSGIDIDIMYVKIPATLTADGDSLSLPVQMGEDVVNYVMARAYERLDDNRSSQQWVAYEAKLAVARHEATVRQSNSYPAIRLTEADWDY